MTRVLVADDDLVPRHLLQRVLREWGYEVEACADGEEALAALQRPDAPRIAILDWVMPGMDGIEVCRRLRERETQEPVYLILLTCRDGKEDIVAGLRSGANDYVTKPFDRAELHARIQVGHRVVELQQSLAARVRELEAALNEVRQLRRLLPICSYCKKIRDDQNYWEEVDQYLGKHTDIHFSHSVCPDCWRQEIQPQLDQLKTSGPAPEGRP